VSVRSDRKAVLAYAEVHIAMNNAKRRAP